MISDGDQKINDAGLVGPKYKDVAQRSTMRVIVTVSEDNYDIDSKDTTNEQGLRINKGHSLALVGDSCCISPNAQSECL